MDTARGRPSGTATMMIVKAIVKKSNSLIRVSDERSSLSVKAICEERKIIWERKIKKPTK